MSVPANDLSLKPANRRNRTLKLVNRDLKMTENGITVNGGEEMACLAREPNETRKTAAAAEEKEEPPAIAEEEEEPLPADLVETIYYITSDSWAPPYLVKTFAKDRTFFSRVIWSFFGICLWVLFIGW